MCKGLFYKPRNELVPALFLSSCKMVLAPSPDQQRLSYYSILSPVV